MYDHVIWPLPFDPKTSAIYALNDIDVNAPPQVVWKLLVDAENWSSYFPAEDSSPLRAHMRANPVFTSTCTA